MDNEKEIPFRAFDSELMHQEIFIPEGFEATIEGNKIILKKTESDDVKIRKELIKVFSNREKYLIDQSFGDITVPEILAWLEKQGDQKLPIEKLPEEMKTVGESLGFTTQKECDEYNQMVSDLIMSDSKVEQKPTCLLDNSKSNVEFPFKAKVKRNGKIVTIYGGQLSMVCNEYVKYQSNVEDGYKVYEPEDLELVCNIEQKPNDKVEPKFKVGDEVITKNEESLTITKIDKEGYWSNDLFICSFDDSAKWELVGKLIDKDESKLTEFEDAVKDMMDDYRDAIDENAATTEEVKEHAAYLLSLIPHKPAEWSEEDEKKQKKNY